MLKGHCETCVLHIVASALGTGGAEAFSVALACDPVEPCSGWPTADNSTGWQLTLPAGSARADSASALLTHRPSRCTAEANFLTQQPLPLPSRQVPPGPPEPLRQACRCVLTSDPSAL